jgi:hypothetical protein
MRTTGEGRIHPVAISTRVTKIRMTRPIPAPAWASALGKTEAAEHRHDLPLSAESGHLNGHRAAGAGPVAVIRCLRSVFETVVDLLAARRIWRVSCTARICADCPGPSQLW